ncbi:MAG TPA: hypothetical protein VFV02_12175, partial [Acidimicrobiales bacterium]|nr:hypothetical protein [Acidimicrobiales bacterium]
MQRQVAEVIAGLDAANGFGLAGGAALILRRDIDRALGTSTFSGSTVPTSNGYCRKRKLRSEQ